jgi:hypothetical protein
VALSRVRELRVSGPSVFDPVPSNCAHRCISLNRGVLPVPRFLATKWSSWKQVRTCLALGRRWTPFRTTDAAHFAAQDRVGSLASEKLLIILGHDAELLDAFQLCGRTSFESTDRPVFLPRSECFRVFEPVGWSYIPESGGASSSAFSGPILPARIQPSRSPPILWRLLPVGPLASLGHRL